jgi:hypothetical protein
MSEKILIDPAVLIAFKEGAPVFEEIFDQNR